MRCVPMLMAVLLLALPASADETTVVFSAPSAAAPAKPVAKIKKEAAKPAQPKPAQPKPVAAVAAKTTTQTAPKLPQPKPAQAKAEPQKAVAKIEPTKAAEPKAAEPKAVEPKPETKSGGGKAGENKAAESAAPTADAFAGIPQGERLRIQAALLWSSDYSTTANGEDPLLAALKNFQKRKKTSVTGALTPAERAELIAAAQEREQEFGWSVVVDPATGIRIGLPTKMVPHAQETARGTRWSSAHGEVQVETFRIADANLKLSDLFEQEKKEPAGRKVEYSVLRDDSFYISGLQGLKKFGVRATIRNGEVRGFTMLFDQMMETIVAPVTVAMASAFSPFPDRTAPFAALTKSVEYGNGLVVSAQGHIVTNRALTDDCQVLVASGLGDAVRIADDKNTGLALVRVFAPRKATLPAALPADAVKTGDVTLVGLPDPKEQDGNAKLTEIKARLLDGSAIELRQPVPLAGFSGAAAVDTRGRVAGLMQMRNAVLASIEPAAPPVRLIAAAAIRGFLDAHSVPAPSETGDAKAAVVRMICVRK